MKKTITCPCCGMTYDRTDESPEFERVEKWSQSPLTGFLKDAAFQLGRLTGENLEIYAKTWSTLALEALQKAGAK